MRALLVIMILLTTACDSTEHGRSKLTPINEHLERSAGQYNNSAMPIGSETLCKTGEILIFQCKSGNKILSICGIGNGSDARYPQFRMGTLKIIDVQYPTENESKSSMRIARTGYSGGGEVQYSFDHDGKRFIIYGRVVKVSLDNMGRPRHVNERGLVALKNGAIMNHIVCDDQSGPNGIVDPDRYFEQGEFVYIPDDDFSDSR